MTQRLYYSDSYTTQFMARIVERLTLNDKPALILDQTCFYPDSGGQPSDDGMINGIPVVDLKTRDKDGAVIHVLKEPTVGDIVEGRVEWARRFDHMQHHTGQHILTQAFVQMAGANTVGFHLSPDSVTIDLDKINLTLEAVNQAEDLANRIVWENRPVTARLVQPDDAEGVRVRKLPGHLLTDGLRVIDIEGFDVTACGGTHVARTGEIGIIKVIKLERRGDKTRVEFRCGGRALRDYQQKNTIVSQLVSDLNCHPSETVQAVTRLREDYKQALQAQKAASAQLIEYEAEHLLNHTSEQNGIRLVKATFENRDAGELRLLASQLTQTSKVVALTATAGEKAHFVFARSADLTADMNALLKSTLTTLGGRGGGQPGLAQGGGMKANLSQVQAALDEAEQSILS